MDVLVREFYYLPEMNKMAHVHFSHLSNMPTIKELEKSISVILVNNHIGIFNSRPIMPGMIDIAGAHIRWPLKQLPNEIQNFLDEAENGVIYVSFGSLIQSSKMPKEKLRMFINVFGSLKQRVLWKYEGDDLKNLSSNLMIRKWMPLTEILNYLNVVLFISHGGLFGSIEGKN